MKTFLFVVLPFSFIMAVITEKSGFSKKYGLQTKMLCSAMFVLTGIASFFAHGTITSYSVVMLCALVCGFFGDFLLSYKNEKYFLSGVVFFALGHIIYSFAFLFPGTLILKFRMLLVFIISALITAALIGVLRKKINLGRYQKFLFVYGGILVFSFVSGVFRGISEFSDTRNIPFGICVLAGALLFFISDVCLGMSMGGIKLAKPFTHIVLYTYFPAQTFFALSIFFH